jgi:hypothetical protein
MSVLTVHSATAPTMRRSALILVARLKRFLNGWVAAAIAYRERQTTLFALSQRDDRKLDETRVYRGPIDDALEKAMRLRERRLKHP